MLNFSGPNERAKITPTLITVVPTICQPQDPESGAPFEAVAVASAVPTTWAALNPTVLPEPVVRQQGDAFERERILLGLYQRSRFIRVVAVLDIAFIIVFGLFSPVFFILLPFPICGYWGAKKWIYRLLFIYAVYLLIEIIGGIVSMIFIHAPAFVAIRIIYVLMNIVIARYTTNLASYILVLGAEDFEFLKNSPMIRNTEKSLLC